MSSEIGDSSEGSRKEIQCKYKSISKRVGVYNFFSFLFLKKGREDNWGGG